MGKEKNTQVRKPKNFQCPFPPTALQIRHAQTVRDRSSSYKKDFVIVIKNFPNPEGHANLISGSKVTAVLLKASAGEGLRLLPVQQAFFFNEPLPYKVLVDWLVGG